MRLLLAATVCLLSGPTLACEIDGDSIAFGLAPLMPECRHSAQNGITSAAVAARVHGGGDLVIASAGSNDSSQLARIPPALDRILARSRRRLLLILPSNAARGTVAGWAARHRVRTVSFTPGDDGIHPRDYGELAASVRGAL